MSIPVRVGLPGTPVVRVSSALPFPLPRPPRPLPEHRQTSRRRRPGTSGPAQETPTVDDPRRDTPHVSVLGRCVVCISGRNRVLPCGWGRVPVVLRFDPVLASLTGAPHLTRGRTRGSGGHKCRGVDKVLRGATNTSVGTLPVSCSYGSHCSYRRTSTVRSTPSTTSSRGRIGCGSGLGRSTSCGGGY